MASSVFSQCPTTVGADEPVALMPSRLLSRVRMRGEPSRATRGRRRPRARAAARARADTDSPAGECIGVLPYTTQCGGLPNPAIALQHTTSNSRLEPLLYPVSPVLKHTHAF